MTETLHTTWKESKEPEIAPSVFLFADERADLEEAADPLCRYPLLAMGMAMSRCFLETRGEEQAVVVFGKLVDEGENCADGKELAHQLLACGLLGGAGDAFEQVRVTGIEGPVSWRNRLGMGIRSVGDFQDDAFL